MSTVQSYWLVLAAAAGAVGGVSTDVAVNRFMPPQQQAQPVQQAQQSPATDQLHADLVALRQDLAGGVNTQNATLAGMYQIMQRGETERNAMRAADARITRDMHSEAESMRQQAQRMLGPSR